MSILGAIFIIGVVISFLILFSAIFLENGDLVGVGLVMLGIGVFALIPIASCTWKTETINVKMKEITKSKSAVYVRDEVGVVHTFDTKFDYDNITDSTKFYRNIHLNHLGAQVSSELLYY